MQVGADIVKRALSYPLKLIAKNAGVNGSVVSEKVLSYYDLFTMICHPWIMCFDCCILASQVLANDNARFGYNAATDKYEDLMSAGIIDPTKVSYYTASANILRTN